MSAARRAARDDLRERASPHYVPSQTTLHRVIPVWLAARQLEVTRQTYKNYRSHMNRISDALGLIEIAAIDRSHIEKFVARRFQQGVKPRTIRVEVGTLATLLEWCFRNRIVGKVVTRDVCLRKLGLPTPRWFALQKLGRIHLEVTNDRRDRIA